MDMNGKCSVITGCNRGIGRATMELFARNGSDIFAIVRKNDASFQKCCDALEDKYGVTIIPVEIEFNDEKSVKAGVKAVLDTKKRVDVIVNNVGSFFAKKSIFMTRIAEIHEAMQVNYISQVYVTQLLAKRMVKQQEGSIVFVASDAAFDGGPNVGYTSSKAAVIGAVRRLALELGAYNIRVNAVAPGLTDTDMAQCLNEQDKKDSVEMTIMKRMGKPEEIAEAVMFLASDRASFITSQVLRVDGGSR